MEFFFIVLSVFLLLSMMISIYVFVKFKSEWEKRSKEFDEMSARVDRRLKSVGERPKGKPLF